MSGDQFVDPVEHQDQPVSGGPGRRPLGLHRPGGQLLEEPLYPPGTLTSTSRASELLGFQYA
jgi:hypothetical protein